MRTLFLTALGLLAAPAMAQSYGGGGIVVQQGSLNWQLPEQTRNNSIGCIGGIGFSVRDGKRKGGEGHYCSGPYSNLAMGGLHFGLQGKRAGTWLMAYNTVGLGWVGVASPAQGRFDGVFAYTRPVIGGGTALNSWLGVEAGAYLNLPVNVIGVVSSGMDAKFTFPHAGVQATLLFGDFTRRNKGPSTTPQEVPLAVPADGRPPAPRDGPRSVPRATERPSPAPTSGPLRPGDLPPAEGKPSRPPAPRDERPLAIPG